MVRRPAKAKAPAEAKNTAGRLSTEARAAKVKSAIEKTFNRHRDVLEALAAADSQPPARPVEK